MRRSTWSIFILSAVMVNNPTQQDVPAFYSPLTHDQHAQLGRIAILWGHVDVFVDNLLTAVLHGDAELRANLFNDKPISAKLDFLTSRLKLTAISAERELFEDFIEAVHSVKAERNACFHGVWGFRIGKGKVEAAAQHHRAPDGQFKAERLPKLERSLCRVSHQGRVLLERLGLLGDLGKGAQPMFHGQPPEQAWFEEWLEQRKMDHQTLDYRWRPGRLPFLKRPL